MTTNGPAATPRVVAVVTAHDEADRIAETVRHLAQLPAVHEVVVVDDGSADRTAEVARAAGARVLAATRRLGKGGALDRALDEVGDAGVFLLVDGDVAGTAGAASALLDPVVAGEADAAIGRLPGQAGGGLGSVKRLAAVLIGLLGGFQAQEPLSGQRAVTAEALAACRPLAGGFGVETAMTIDLCRLGFRVVEVDVSMTHRPTGRTLRGFAHRGRQGFDILLAAIPRALRLR